MIPTHSRFRYAVLLRTAFALVWFLVTIPLLAAENARPNFVFVLGEGSGWVHTSVQMDPGNPDSKSRVVSTPQFDRLAHAGMRFARFYAPSGRCTPSRAAYLTGKSTGKLKMTFVTDRTGPNSKLIPPRHILELPESEQTIPELLKGVGYATAHFGKWHVGHNDPGVHGFDVSDGANQNGGPENVQNPNPKQLYLTTEKGIAFMTRNVEAKTPFYLQISHYGSRGERDARDQARPGQPVEGLDTDIATGRLLDAIDELGIAGNTYVIYTTDHGTPGRSNGPLNKGKGTVWEGGLRVPLFVRGPGIAPNSFSNVRARGADLLPTIVDLAGVTQLPEGLEGGSLAPVLTGGGAGAVRRVNQEMVFHFPHYDSDPMGPSSAILLGDYKLIRYYERPDAPLLFNLKEDLGEQRDLAATMPDKTAELDRRLTAYLRSIDAQMPTANPNYDPTQPSVGSDSNRNRENRDRGQRRGANQGRNQNARPSP
ncbi:MAG: sulfatase-like hydrolase/transferase [Planctomycetota bacterium]|jgi:arylsulfatase A-like enzyme